MPPRLLSPRGMQQQETTTTTTSAVSTSGVAAAPGFPSRISTTSRKFPPSPKRLCVLLRSHPPDGLLAMTPAGSVSGRDQSGVPNYLADRAGRADHRHRHPGQLRADRQPQADLIRRLHWRGQALDAYKPSENWPPWSTAATRVATGESASANVASANMVDKGEKRSSEHTRQNAAAAGQLAPRATRPSVVRWAGRRLP